MSADEVIAIPIPMGSGGSNFSVPQMSAQNKAELIDKIKPETMVEIIRHRLMGQEWDGNKRDWVDVKALKDRKLSDIGAWELSNLMLGVSSINISISKLNDHEIKGRLLRIAKTAQILMIGNWRVYGIKNTSQFHFVHEIIFSNTLAVLKQADEASIQDLLKATIYEQRSVQMSPQKEPKGEKLSRMLGLSS